MLSIEHTPQMAGVYIKGDSEDFEDLYDALHAITGDEDHVKDHYDVRIRVLGLCYDLRHARMGHRHAFLKSHGLDRDQMAFLSVVGPTQNLYLSFETYWPELLFITFALEDFIKLYTKREKAHPWDGHVMTVRKFQSLVANLLEETVTPRQFSLLKKGMQPEFIVFKGYFTQYVDFLNLEWIEFDEAKRLKTLSTVARKFVQPNHEYEIVKKEIIAAAKKHHCHPSEIRYGGEYPDSIEW